MAMRYRMHAESVWSVWTKPFFVTLCYEAAHYYTENSLIMKHMK
jgi:hypothetical protein